MKNGQEITTEIVSEIKELVGSNLLKIILYGSYARGDFDEESDIDIMILVKGNQDVIKQYEDKSVKIASRIGMSHNIMVALVYCNDEEFQAYASFIPYYTNIQKEGVVLYGGQ